jgi:hypothetical protein
MPPKQRPLAPPPPQSEDEDDYISYKELKDMMQSMIELFTKNQRSTDTTLEWVQRVIADVVGRVDALEARLLQLQWRR